MRRCYVKLALIQSDTKWISSMSASSTVPKDFHLAPGPVSVGLDLWGEMGWVLGGGGGGGRGGAEEVIGEGRRS